MNTTGKRGFAAMDRQKQRDIASQGGRASHRSGNAHQFTSEEASAAAKKGHAMRKDARINAINDRARKLVGLPPSPLDRAN